MLCKLIVGRVYIDYTSVCVTTTLYCNTRIHSVYLLYKFMMKRHVVREIYEKNQNYYLLFIQTTYLCYYLLI